mmetsp:Transcript_11897/g.18365  ORF Transcript_11897/g.18365 Transcript_11897/m.18365 type:complete len:137 (+) Transcript_11897:212-622(+)
MNKKEGKIRIILQLVKFGEANAISAVDFLKKEVTEFYSFNLVEATNQEGDPYSLFHRKEVGPEYLVLTVMDNGVGIKEADKSKLFKLFGCLKSTRSMNTQGIGLGLVITKMITEEFGGNTNMFSLFGAGSVFQSSF